MAKSEAPNFDVPEIVSGSVVITPTENLPYITAHKKYVVLDKDDKWVQIVDDNDSKTYYHTHLFIDANVYYRVTMWFTLARIFDLELDY